MRTLGEKERERKAHQESRVERMALEGKAPAMQTAKDDPSVHHCHSSQFQLGMDPFPLLLVVGVGLVLQG